MARRGIRLFLVAIGFLAVVPFFVPHAAGRWIEARLVDWLVLLETAALIAGIVALARRHMARVRTRVTSDRFYSGLVLAGMAVMMVAGALQGTGTHSVFGMLYRCALQPIQASVLSLLAFYMASAVFRSFRLTSAPATILLISALTVLLAKVPLGEQLIPRISMFATWIIRGPNVAATRGLWIGIGLAGCATALRVILGIQGPRGMRRS